MGRGAAIPNSRLAWSKRMPAATWHRWRPAAVSRRAKWATGALLRGCAADLGMEAAAAEGHGSFQRGRRLGQLRRADAGLFLTAGQ